MDRRTLLGTALAGLFGDLGRALVPAASAQAPAPFGFDAVVQRAREVAAAPFQPPRMTLAEPFAGLSYDAFRGIRFRDAARVFAGGGAGFQMDLLPPGFHYQDRVEISVVANGAAMPLAFSTDLFDFQPGLFPYADGRAPAGLAADHGFSGFRLRHPINRPGVWDEFAVFQGASYFRAVARDTLYGLSARGLAIGTAGPAEEFPLFRAFWIEAPAPGAATLRLYALLDGPSVAGAYAFAISPGAETAMEIEARLFPRADIFAAGIAPLTSMYYFGPESRRDIDDFRDAVHDSCGLWMVNGSGERLWRPLRNPAGLEVSFFADVNPRSFGLLQRFRDFEHFQDAEARYEKRPSAWVEPRGDWGQGGVTLIEIPAADEATDNIVAFWRPQEPLRAGVERSFAYRLTWSAGPDGAALAQVAATRTGHTILAPHRDRVFVIDFDLGSIDAGAVAPVLEATAGVVKGLSLAPLPGEGNLVRVGFSFDPAGAAQTEFRLRLDSAGRPASEIWLYRWTA